MPIKPEQKRFDISRKELKALQRRIKQHKLRDDDYKLVQALAAKDASIGRLCKYWGPGQRPVETC